MIHHLRLEQPLTVSYKYNEGPILQEVQDYIDGTYDEHYSTNNYQATEFIIDGGHGEGGDDVRGEERAFASHRRA